MVNCCRFLVNHDNIIHIRAKFQMVRASHLTENHGSASIGVHSFVATVALNCSSSVDHGEDSYQVRGQCQSPP